MNFARLVRSFVVGFQGLAHVIGSEQNMRIHCVIAVGVIGAGFLLALSPWEWLAVVLCIGLVLAAECLNTALERLADRVTTETDPLIKQAKDCGSAAVLVLAMMSVGVGVVVFAPKIWSLAGW